MATFGILGPIELRAGDRRVPAGGPRQLALLAFLLLHANRAVSNDQLQDALWGDDGGGGIKAVQMAVARLRRSLEPLRAGDEPVLRTVSGGYLLSVAPGELDADVFEDGVARGRERLGTGDPAGASEAFEAALALWRGPALAEVAFERFARADIKRLEELRLAATESRIEADLALGRHATVVAELELLSAEHPERERTCAQLMLALYRAGRASEALDAYHRVSAHLSSELGLAPGPSLQALRRAIVEQSPSLRLGAPVTVAASEEEPAFALQPAVRTGARGAFAGRGEAVGTLASIFEHAASGTRRIAMLSGEPGIGKTRLATELGAHAHGRGAIVLYGRCDEEPLLPHQPFVEALRHYVASVDAGVLSGQVQLITGELRRVVPELAERVPGLAPPLAGDPDGARYRLFEAVTALLCEAAQHRPLVLVLDDLHWADEATLLLLKYVARYPREARLMVVGTYREMDLEPEHRLNGVLADLAREQAFERIALGRLDAGAVSELVAHSTGDSAPPELHRLVFEETGGNAFFVVEILRHLAESGVGAATLAPRGLPLPEGVRDLIGRRLVRLGERCNRALGVASVLGRSFQFDTLERICGLGQDELVDALEGAVRAQILEESTASVGSYAFSHALIREVLYSALAPTRRALLHRRAALAIEDARAGDLEPHLAELASHFGQAGADADLDKAIAYGARAGERAVALLAYEQAAGHYRRAIELLDRRGAPVLERCDLTIARGEAERMAGDPAYRGTLLEGARIALEAGDVQRLARAALANSRGFSGSSQGVDRDLVAMLRRALDALGDGDSPTRASLLALLAVELIADADSGPRARLGDEALAMARRIGEPRTLARVLTQRAVARWQPGGLPELNANLLEAWELAERSGEPLVAAYAAYFGTHAALEAGDLALSDRFLDSLGRLVRQLGQPIVAWYDAVARAKRCTVVGSPHEAEALAFAAFELGTRAGQPDAIVWFLGQIFAVRFLQGTLAEGEPNLPQLFEEPGSAPVVGPEFTPSRSIPLLVGAAVSAILCEVGRAEDGRRHFDVLAEELSDLPNDYATLATLAQAAVACWHLGDSPRAALIDELLEPYADQFVNTGASWFGSVAHHLALMCATMDRPGDADARFAAAEAAYAKLGADAWHARCRLDWASALVARSDGDLARAGALLDDVLASARALDLPRIEARASALRAAAAAR